MKIAEGSIITDVGHTLVIYDTETDKYRLLVYEEDGVLRILAAEPVVLVTEEDDLVARHKRSPARELDNYLERK